MKQATQKYLLGLVKKNYDDIAQEFDQTRQKEPWSELNNLTEPVKDGDSVLDVGCGNGRLARLFFDKKVKYLGIDSSAGLVELAKRNFPDYHFAEGNILDLSHLKTADFDYIYCIAVLHHLPGIDLQTAALEQLKNKIKPSGKIIITVWNLWEKPKFRKLIYKFAWLKVFGMNKMDFGDIIFSWKNSLQEKLSQRYYHAFTERGLKKIVELSGLQIEKIYMDKYNYYLILKK